MSAIEANLAALASGLREAAALAAEAHTAMQTRRRNLAIGTVLPLEQDLLAYASC